MKTLYYCYIVCLTLMLLGCDHHHSGAVDEFSTNVAKTKEKTDANQIWQVTLPLFSQKFDKLSGTNLPNGISSLPLFSGNRNDVYCYHANTNALVIACGGAFGQWGLIISKDKDSSVTNLLSHAVAMPWGAGIFFWREL